MVSQKSCSAYPYFAAAFHLVKVLCPLDKYRCSHPQTPAFHKLLLFAWTIMAQIFDTHHQDHESMMLGNNWSLCKRKRFPSKKVREWTGFHSPSQKQVLNWHKSCLWGSNSIRSYTNSILRSQGTILQDMKFADGCFKTIPKPYPNAKVHQRCKWKKICIKMCQYGWGRGKCFLCKINSIQVIFQHKEVYTENNKSGWNW